MSDDAQMRLTTVLEADISDLTAKMDKARAQTSDALDDMGGQVERGQKRIQAAIDKIKANNAIKIAVAAGDDGAVAALQEQLALQKEIARFQRAGLGAKDAEAQARAHVTAVQQAAAQAAAAQRAAAMQQIQLEERLQVAQASGNRREIEQLQEQLSLAQRIARYRQAGMDQHTATHLAESHMASMALASAGNTPGLNRAQTMELTHVAKSLFDQMAAGASPMRALEVEGGRIVQVFSEGEGGVGGTFKALTGLINPMTVSIGAAAAAAVTLAVVMGRVHEAAQEVVDLKVSSDKLGIPVEQLQQWQFIAAQTHVSNADLDRSFEGLTATLGKLKSGIREQRIQPFIQELGISDADIAKANNAADLLDLIMSKMGKIKDQGERTQIADAFGMQSALPLLQRTRAEIQGMSDDLARNAGVISGEQADALDKQEQALNRAHTLMHDKIRSDLIVLAPLVNDLALAWDGVAEAAVGALADMVRAGSYKPGQAGQAEAAASAGPVGGLAHIVGGLVGGAPGAMAADYVNRLVGHLTTPDTSHSAVAIPHGAASASAGPTGAQLTKATDATDAWNKAIEENVTHTKHAVDAQKLIDDTNAARKAAGQAPVSKADADKLLANARAQDAKSGEAQDRKAAAQAKKAMAEDEASDNAIAKAKKDELEAHIKLTADLAAEHQLRLDELKAQRDSANRQANQDAAQGKISPQAARQVVASNNGTYDDKVALENREYQQQQADQQRTYTDDLARYQIAHLTAAAAIASTAEAWAAQTKAAFAQQQAMDRGNFVAGVTKRTQETGVNHLDAGQARAEVDAYDAQQAEQASKEGRDVDLQVLERKKAFSDQLQGYVSSTLESEAAIATTTEQRQAIELKLLQMRQQQARDALSAQIRKEHIAPDQAAQLQSGLAQSQAAETSAMVQQQERSANPLYAYGHPTTSMAEDTQGVAVQGIEGFTSDLVNATTDVKHFGDSLRQTALQVAQALLKEMITRDIAQPGAQSLFSMFGGGGASPGGGAALGAASGLGSLLGSAAPGGASSSSQSGWYGLTPNGELDSALTNSGMDPTGGGGDLNLIGKSISDAGMFAKLFGLPGLQDGSDDAHGGPTLVGESGPEVLNLPHGSSVTNNNQLMNAMGRIQVPQGGGTVTMNHQITVDVTGANGDDAIRRIATQAAAAGTAHAIAQSRSDLAKSRKSTQRSLMNY